jgi:phosphatidylglycerophosphatase C
MIPTGERIMTVAAFDFDGTLSTRDNLVPFLRRVAGTRRTNRALLAALPSLVVGHRDGAKAVMLRRSLAGIDEARLAETGAEFAKRVIATHLRDDVVSRARWHREQGHSVVMVSASLTSFLEPIGEHLGFDAVLATRVEVDADGRCTGRIIGANVRGKEKARRLDEWLGSQPATIWAYGNSHGDAALLARADHPVRVGRHRRLTTAPC